MSYTQAIYNRLRQNGLSEVAALAFLGNWQCESGNEPFRLQGDFSPYRTASKYYASKVQTGITSKTEFSRDAKGFGLAQWTYYSRKEDLYDFWKKRGGAIDDALMQVDFAVWELAHSFPDVRSALKAETDLYRATDIICRKYERPAVNNVDARFAAAKRLQNELDLNSWKSEKPVSVSDGQECDSPSGGVNVPSTVEKCTCELPVLSRGCFGRAVVMLQSSLNDAGYNCGTVDGDFGQNTQKALMDFQLNEPELKASGKTDAGTWKALFGEVAR